MSLQKHEVEEIYDKRRIVDERLNERNYGSKRKSVSKIINNSGMFPGLLASYSSKFLKKTSQKSKSPLQGPSMIKNSSINTFEKIERRQPTENISPSQLPKQNPNFSSPKSQVSGSILLSSSLQQQIKRIKTLSRFMLDMKLPSAIPSRTRRDREKERRMFNLDTEIDEQRPLIEVKMERKNGFLRPVMLVRETIQHQNEQREQAADKRQKSLITKPRDKEKLKTAPEISQFGLHIKSHQEIFDQEIKMKQTKNEIIKRFRTTWTRKLSKSSKKLPEIQVSPWIVTEIEQD